MSSFYISAAHKSSGKTTISIGLAAAFRKRGLAVQTFKKGPDYIDPIWLSQASGNESYNLDFFSASPEFNIHQFQTYAQNKDITMVEGNMGLFDGISLDGSDSNAAMAKLLKTPVVLVVDCSGTSRGIAPLLLGYQNFDSNLAFAGVILNKVAGSRHETKMRQVIEAYTDFDVLGVIHRNKNIQLTERHLGLMPSHEMSVQADIVIDRLAELIGDSIDLDTLINLPDSPILNEKIEKVVPSTHQVTGQQSLRIAYARDEAFGFYYPNDLQRFVELGVELVPFDTTSSHYLPENIDGLFIGGGFPESRLPSISNNQTLLTDIKQKIEAGLPAYAECGGLMYLCSEMMLDSKTYPLCDLIPAQVVMNQRPQGRGYVVLEPTQNHLWCRNSTASVVSEVKAHEFHYSSLSGLPDSLNYAYSIKRGTGIDGMNDGIVLYNLLASYVHLRQTDQCSWVDDFVSFVAKCKSS
jgi:cobyrinic acid a,c-diamide synthase